MAFVSVARTHIGCKRNLNEDAFLDRPDVGLWAIADGMGGHDRGEVASAKVIASLNAAAHGSSLLARALAARSALCDVNAELVRLGREAPVPGTIGATVVALLCDGKAFMCVWAGDSRAYRVRCGDVQALTRDHSLVQRLVDAGEISQVDARDHPNANVITRAVGADPVLEVDLIQDDVQPGDIFVLTSDGVTRLVTEGELLARLDRAALSASADRIVDLVLSRGAPDNLTLILVAVPERRKR